MIHDAIISVACVWTVVAHSTDSTTMGPCIGDSRHGASALGAEPRRVSAGLRRDVEASAIEPEMADDQPLIEHKRVRLVGLHLVQARILKPRPIQLASGFGQPVAGE